KHYKAKILLTSSCVVYGIRHSEISTFSEDYWGYVNFLSPRACYDEGRRFAETAFITYKNVYQIPIKIARIFRTYGPRMPLFDGQMIADFVLQALTNQPLVIYGDQNFATSLCYISDIVEGLIRMMNSSETGPINLGSPREYKLADVAQQIIKMCNSQSIITHQPSLKFISALGLPNIGLAKKKLDWYPVISLEEGLKNTIDYIQRHRLQLEPLANQQYQQDGKSEKS
ncbi:MAG: GDP-mannose 4,6-dehydratase, partial [Candidatus Aenigmarchaeota archaeon]|nr:GDP-mannose 4,6-dehydratase [Candidatus Aenigmarchaeota archaeon]